MLVLRSTVYPGVIALVEKMIARLGYKIDVAFCPERIAEGQAMTELFELPQIISARPEQAYERASSLFSLLTADQVRMSPEEAELAKLFTNVWRYIKFATANQLQMIVNHRWTSSGSARALCSTTPGPPTYPRPASRRAGAC